MGERLFCVLCVCVSCFSGFRGFVLVIRTSKLIMSKLQLIAVLHQDARAHSCV